MQPKTFFPWIREYHLFHNTCSKKRPSYNERNLSLYDQQTPFLIFSSSYYQNEAWLLAQTLFLIF